jgi:hypothetical protein
MSALQNVSRERQEHALSPVTGTLRAPEVLGLQMPTESLRVRRIQPAGDGLKLVTTQNQMVGLGGRCGEIPAPPPMMAASA